MEGSHYIVETGTNKVAELLKTGRYAIAVDHRQAGKTTLALYAQQNVPGTMHISLQAFKVELCTCMKMSMKSKRLEPQQLL